MAIAQRLRELAAASLAAAAVVLGTGVSSGEIGGLEEPLLPFSTYLGGVSEDHADAAAVGPDGVLWVAVSSQSSNFPGAPRTPPVYAGQEVVVVRIDAATHTVLSALRLGGSSWDWVAGLVVDATGNAYVARGSFVARILPDGTGVAWTYDFGGSNRDVEITAMCLTADGDPVVVGTTSSTAFPLVSPLLPAYGGGRSDAFVARLRADGTGPVFSTYLGGSYSDEASGVCVAPDGGIVVAGESGSVEFVGSAEQIVGAPSDEPIYWTYLAELEPSGTNLRRVGRMRARVGTLTCAVGRLVVTGSAYAEPGLPIPGLPIDGPPAFDEPGVYVLVLDAATWEPIGGSVVGSRRELQPTALGVGPDGTAWVAGWAWHMPSLSVPGALRPLLGSDIDAYVAAFEPSGFTQVFGTYLGGNRDDVPLAVAVGADGSAYVVGYTESTNFPTSHAVQSNLGGSPPYASNVFVAQLRAGDATSRPAAVAAATAELVDANSIRVRWSPGGGAATAFAIDRSEIPDSGSFFGWSRVALVPGDAVEWVDSDVWPDRTYRYSIQAVNPAGGSAASAAIDVPVAATLSVSVDRGTGAYVRRWREGTYFDFGVVRLRGRLLGGPTETPDLRRDGLRVIVGEIEGGDVLLAIPPGDGAWHKRDNGILRWRRPGAHSWVDFNPRTGAFDLQRMSRFSEGVNAFLGPHWVEQRRVRVVVGGDVGSTAATWRAKGRWNRNWRIRTP